LKTKRPPHIAAKALPPGLFGLLILSFLPLGSCAGETKPEIAIGRPAPDFSRPSLAGSPVTLSSFEGQAVVLNFWATWCQPCRKEFPELLALESDPRIKVVSVALDEDGAASVDPFVRREGLDYLVLLGDQPLFELFAGFSIPYTLVLDPSGTIVNIYRGPVDRASIEGDLRRMDHGV
jgi:thiol-disulfide isomerase/thioredoxin